MPRRRKRPRRVRERLRHELAHPPLRLLGDRLEQGRRLVPRRRKRPRRVREVLRHELAHPPLRLLGDRSPQLRPRRLPREPRSRQGEADVGERLLVKPWHRVERVLSQRIELRRAAPQPLALVDGAQPVPQRCEVDVVQRIVVLPVEREERVDAFLGLDLLGHIVDPVLGVAPVLVGHAISIAA